MNAADAAAAALTDAMVLLGTTAPHGFGRVRDGVGALVSGCPAPTLNGVVCGRRDVPDTVSELADAVAATGLPYCVQTRPGDTAAEDVARARGLVAAEQVPLMVLADVTALGGLVADVPVAALGPEGVGTHLDVLVAGFEAPAAVFAPLRGSDLLRHVDVTAYVVEVDGAPVATSVGVVAGDHVAVFNVATDPAHRGRGYGAALTARAVADGAKAGARAALLQSSEMGRSVYERLGFRTVEEWTVWLPAPASATAGAD